MAQGLCRIDPLILKSEAFTFAEGEDPDVLLQKFAELCLPTKNIIMDVFNTTNQKPGESIQSYVSTLKILEKKKCDFGILNDELIRDRIFCGSESDSVRKQLLCEKKLMLDSAVNICLLHEQSEKSTKELKHEAEVCTIQDRCFNCTRYHAPDKLKCFAFNKQCNSCGK